MGRAHPRAVSPEDLDFALARFERVGRGLGIL
jgi:hypothetical protein